MAYTKVGLVTDDIISQSALDHYENGISAAAIAADVQTALASKAPLNNPAFQGTVTGITKTMVGLANVDNTSDVNKPLSTAAQLALNNKAPLDSPAFTGNPTINGTPLTGSAAGNIQLSYDQTNGLVTTGAVAYSLSYSPATGIITAS